MEKFTPRRLRPLVTDWEWQMEGACNKRNTQDFFFHPDGEKGAKKRRRENQAKAVCAGCPVLETCLDWSLRTQQENGTLGGLTEDERRAVLFPNRAKKHKPKPPKSS